LGMQNYKIKHWLTPCHLMLCQALLVPRMFQDQMPWRTALKTAATDHVSCGQKTTNRSRRSRQICLHLHQNQWRHLLRDCHPPLILLRCCRREQRCLASLRAVIQPRRGQVEMQTRDPDLLRLPTRHHHAPRTAPLHILIPVLRRHLLRATGGVPT
jgi:hypothetical protein